MVLACLMWLIWREQNYPTFENIERPIDLLKSLLARTLFKLSRIWGFTNCITTMSNFLFSISSSI